MQAFYIFKPNTTISTIKYTEIKSYHYLYWERQTKNENYILTPALSLSLLSHEIAKLFKLSITLLKALTVIKSYKKSAIS